MNERDSEAVKGLLLERSYDFTDDMEEADVVLFNTCSVRQHAEDRVFGRAGDLARIKRRRPETVVGILGCMAQEHGADFFRRIPLLDLVCGPGNLSDLPDIIDRVFLGGKKITAIDRLNDTEYSLDGIRYRSHTVKTHVNIMSGCDHKCTYCIVPMTRGIERSRPSDEIVREVKGLAERGFKDVMLLGQNVNCYGKKLDEGIDFTGLLEKIDRESGMPRLRFITSHPKDAHERLFHAIADLPSVCEHLHLPVQSGSNAVLKRMKREHTREWYLDRIAEYRKIVPHGTLTTDIIVGFPGETDADFEDTKSLLASIGFDAFFAFTYSMRPGTPAARLVDDVPEAVKQSRLQEIFELQRGIIFQKNAALIGRREEVLFESALPEGGRFAGRTRGFKRVAVTSGESLLGQIRQVEITQVLNETLLGRVKEEVPC